MRLCKAGVGGVNPFFSTIFRGYLIYRYPLFVFSHHAQHRLKMGRADKP